jgi:hypothetical protein
MVFALVAAFQAHPLGLHGLLTLRSITPALYCWSCTAALFLCALVSFQDASLQDSPITADLLERVAAWLPVEERLGSFSLASRSTHAAAVAATGIVEWYPFIEVSTDGLAPFKQQATS